ncbi:MAG: hypothetical protein Ct9H300mP27_12170 [Chloroflexota bacterium]|nr:MAG: hypothetical protein Ct9H300mP27_12170 [Chloroflexota bacterium]
MAEPTFWNSRYPPISRSFVHGERTHLETFNSDLLSATLIPLWHGSDITVVEVEDAIVEPGELDADNIHVPGVYVDRLVKIPNDGYGTNPNYFNA